MTNRVDLMPLVGPNDHSQGPNNAPLILVEYGDYECPACGAAYPVVKELQQHFGDQLRFVFRNFPLVQSHAHAEEAAEAAEAASENDQFWPMHDMLYEHQDTLDVESLIDIAANLGLDANAFAGDLADQRYHDRVQADYESGMQSGVEGTPTFFINGTRYDDMSDYATLRAALQNVR